MTISKPEFIGIIPLIQSISETMPISSSAHLILASHLLGINLPKLEIIYLHLGTAVAALTYARHLFLQLLKSVFVRTPYTRAALSCIFITLIQITLAFPIKAVLESLESNQLIYASTIGLCSIFSGLALLAASKRPEKNTSLNFNHIIPIALIQTLAFFPGVSRLGASLIAFKLLGFNTKDCWIYSILLGVPLSLGAVTLTLANHGVASFNLSGFALAQIFLGSLVCYKLATRIDLRYYAFYKIFFGAALLYAKM